MTQLTCNGDWLVEYADGELSATDSAEAQSHLAACPGCSRQLVALHHSREKLSAYFGSMDRSPVGWPSQTVRDGRGSPSYKAKQASWNSAAMALASLAATMLLVSLVLFLQRETGQVVKAVAPTIEDPQFHSAQNGPAEDDVLALIARESQIARLRAASEILAKEPGMNERHLAMQQYLAQTYGVE